MFKTFIDESLQLAKLNQCQINQKSNIIQIKHELYLLKLRYDMFDDLPCEYFTIDFTPQNIDNEFHLKINKWDENIERYIKTSIFFYDLNTIKKEIEHRNEYEEMNKFKDNLLIRAKKLNFYINEQDLSIFILMLRKPPYNCVYTFSPKSFSFICSYDDKMPLIELFSTRWNIEIEAYIQQQSPEFQW